MAQLEHFKAIAKEISNQFQNLFLTVYLLIKESDLIFSKLIDGEVAI